MADPGTSAADRAAFDALARLVDPWLYGREDALQDRLAAGAPIDWPAVLALATRHRVMPLLAERVKAAALAPGDECSAILGRQAQGALASELSSLAELRRLKALFDGERIAFLVFKGLILSSCCFGRLGLRTNRDIDILVAPEDMQRGHAALVSAGYVRVDPPAEASPDEVRRSMQRCKDWVYRKADSSAIVELHHRLFDNATLCGPGVMDRARTVGLFDQVEVRTLAAEDELPYLALHGAMHAWSRLKWLLDIAILVRRAPPAQVADILRRNAGGPAGLALHQAIALCWTVFDPDCPRPDGKRPWRASLLSKAAMLSLAGPGAREIEDTRFGTTIKNASHYLLWHRPAYLISELRFDINDTSQDSTTSSSYLPIWLSRPASWLGRHIWK